LRIEVNKLKELMDLLKLMVPKKTALPSAKYIKVGEGKAVATDLETMVIVDLTEAQEPMLLPYFSVAEMLKYLPGNEELTIELKDKKLTLSCSGNVATYPTEAVQDFPVLPEMPARAEGDFDGDTLIAAMTAAVPYAATESNRQVLNGITIVLGKPIEVAAGDGYRMSHQTLGLLSFPLEEKAILPRESILILGHVFAKTPHPADGYRLPDTGNYCQKAGSHGSRRQEQAQAGHGQSNRGYQPGRRSTA
jgi:DNA polymerase III sliding clamp (beta) subunit (PCNA family)